MTTILLAVGGNSLIRAGEKGTVAEQLANARRTAEQIVALCAAGYRIVLTHGNGPQVGAALLRSERAASEVPGQPLDVCDACTQGEIGYLLELELAGRLAYFWYLRAKVPRSMASTAALARAARRSASACAVCSALRRSHSATSAGCPAHQRSRPPPTPRTARRIICCRAISGRSPRRSKVWGRNRSPSAA